MRRWLFEWWGMLVGGTCVCMWRMSGGGPPTSINTTNSHSRGISSYKHFPHKVVDKYRPSSGWAPLVAQWIPIGLPTSLVTPEDLLPRCLQRHYPLLSGTCEGASIWNGMALLHLHLLSLAKALPSEIWWSFFFIFFFWRLRRRYHLKYDSHPSSPSSSGGKYQRK